MPCSSSDGMGSGPGYGDLSTLERRLAERLDALEHQLCAIRKALIYGDNADMVNDQARHEKKPGCERFKGNER